MYPLHFYIIGTIAIILLMASHIPDTVAAIKAKKVKGATWVSPLILQVALVCAMVTSVIAKNWPLVIGDILTSILNITLLIIRFRRR